MVKAVFYLLAAIGYAIFINLAQPVLSRELGDSVLGHWVQVVLVIVPILFLLGMFMREMRRRREGSDVEQSQRQKNRNELLWSGALSLTQAFWLGYVPYGIFSAVCGNYLISTINTFGGNEPKWAVAAFFFVIAILALSIVGVWRSGNRYGGKRLWVSLSRITMALGSIAICLFIFMNSFR